MSKLPNGLRLTPDLEAFLELVLEPYEGDQLERAQNAIRGVYRSK